MDWLRDDGIFMPMINDTGRNIFYKNCIDSIAKDKVICDIGTGTGFLSVLSVQAGAKKVIAIEKDSERYNFTKNNLKKLNLLDKIEIIHADFLDTTISADYFITETFGNAIFEENILAIAEHKKTMHGRLIPDQIEVYVKIYESHPIFAVVQSESDAFEFQPDIDIDKNFFNLINNEYQKSNQSIGRRSNWISNLFKEYKKMTDLRLKEIYKSEPILVDLNKDFPTLEFNLPKSVPPGQFCIFWTLKFNDLIMDVTDTIWSTPTRFIPDTSKGVKIYYDNVNSWWFEWQ